MSSDQQDSFQQLQHEDKFQDHCEARQPFNLSGLRTRPFSGSSDPLDRRTGKRRLPPSSDLTRVGVVVMWHSDDEAGWSPKSEWESVRRKRERERKREMMGETDVDRQGEMGERKEGKRKRERGIYIYIYKYIYIERERETDRQTDRQTDRETGRVRE